MLLPGAACGRDGAGLGGRRLVARMELSWVAGSWWRFSGEGASCLPGWSQCHSSAAPGVPLCTPSPALQGWGCWGRRDEPGGTHTHACYLSVCPAVCEGNFTCKENEVCVRPGECRCRHGYFGANCDTSEYQQAPRCPWWGLLGWPRGPGSSRGDFPEQSIRDGAADALALPLPVPLGLSPGHYPFWRGLL